nr:alcohol dehydrogenase catalytic domain-containing protein [Mesorhizobium sp.]
MKAARFHAKGDVRVEEVELPSELAPDEVLVRNQLCGICGTDLHEFAAGPIFIRLSRTLSPAPLSRKSWGTSSARSSRR